MSTKSIEVADALAPVEYDFGHRPAGNPSVAFPVCEAFSYDFSHRPACGFVTDPPPAPSYVEGFLMSGVRGTGARATWVSAGAPDFSGTYAPGGPALVLASIVIVKRGFNAA